MNDCQKSQWFHSKPTKSCGDLFDDELLPTKATLVLNGGSSRLSDTDDEQPASMREPGRGLNGSSLTSISHSSWLARPQLRRVVSQQEPSRMRRVAASHRLRWMELELYRLR